MKYKIGWVSCSQVYAELYDGGYLSRGFVRSSDVGVDTDTLQMQYRMPLGNISLLGFKMNQHISN